MEYQNLSKQTNSISLYFKYIDESIFKEHRFVDLMNLILKHNKLFEVNYAFYTDNNLLKTNIYIPTFHTMYLYNNTHNVVIEDSEDIWLIDTFSNNKYYVMPKKEDTYDYKQHNIKIIDKIQEIL